jgi:hypothetical protein
MQLKKQIAQFIGEELELYVHEEEVKELGYEVENSNDFFIEIDGKEYRFISEDVIWDAYVSEIQSITLDCYNLKLPNWLAVDWQKTAENCSVGGYGHTFASYDGDEIEYHFNGKLYHIFRIN